jgi:hypothetical protein
LTDTTGLHPPRQGLGAADVPAKHAAGQTVRRVVRQLERLVGIGDSHDRKRRTERLLDHALHRVVNVHQHGRRVEVAVAVAARQDPGALRHRVIDVIGHEVGLITRRQRPDVDRPERAGRALPECIDLPADELDELLVCVCLDVHALDRKARLAGVAERILDRDVRRPLQIGIGEHDHRVLATQLQRHRRE